MQSIVVGEELAVAEGAATMTSASRVRTLKFYLPALDLLGREWSRGYSMDSNSSPQPTPTFESSDSEARTTQRQDIGSFRSRNFIAAELTSTISVSVTPLKGPMSNSRIFGKTI